MRFFVTLRTQNASFRRMRFSSPGQTWRHLTERRTLGPPPHRKARFADVTLTENRILGATPHGKAQSGWFGDRRVRFSVTPSPKSAVWPPTRRQTALFGETAGCRMRFSVTLRTQSALFRRMRFSSPGQTWRHLTERRSLELAPHEKAHSEPVALTERRTLRARFTACFTKKRSLAPAARVCSMLATPYSPKA